MKRRLFLKYGVSAVGGFVVGKNLSAFALPIIKPKPKADTQWVRVEKLVTLNFIHDEKTVGFKEIPFEDLRKGDLFRMFSPDRNPKDDGVWYEAMLDPIPHKQGPEGNFAIATKLVVDPNVI